MYLIFGLLEEEEGEEEEEEEVDQEDKEDKEEKEEIFMAKKKQPYKYLLNLLQL